MWDGGRWIGWSGGEALEWVYRGVPTRAAARVGKVGNGLGGGAEVGGAVRPAHGEDERKGDKRWFAGQAGEGDSQGGDVGGLEPDPVVAVTDIEFEEVCGAVGCVRVVYVVEEAKARFPKLEGAGGGEVYCVGVDAVEQVVDNGAGAAIALGDYADRGDM